MIRATRRDPPGTARRYYKQKTGGKKVTNIVRLDPFSDLRQTMDRLFDEGFSRPWRFLPGEQEATFPIEVSETDHELEVKAALPGIDPNDVEVTIQNDVLTVRGEHKEET